MNLWERIVVYGLLGALFLVGIFLDLPINSALYDPNHVYGQFFEMAGEIFVWILVLFALGIAMRFHPTLKKKWLDVSLTLLCGLLILGVAYYAGHHFLGLLNRVTHKEFHEALSLLYAFNYLILSLPWVFLLSKDHRREMMAFAGIVLLLLATTLVLMQGLKMLWLRPRFRTLIAIYGFEGAKEHFLPVYSITGFWKFDELYGGMGSESVLASLGVSSWGKEEFYSFPSGHTMHATAPLVFCLASSFLPKLKGKEGYIRLFFYSWGALTAAGRMVRGAHFLTDVAFGFFVAVLFFDLYSTFLEKPLLRFYDKHFSSPGEETTKKA